MHSLHQARQKQQTYQGYVQSHKEAMIIIHAVHQGVLPKITERIKHADDIGNGSIFVYEEKTSKIKRWTDARKWGPSRVSEGFMEYHEASDRYSKRKLDKFKLDTSSSRKFSDAKGAYIFKDDGLIKRTINDEVEGNVYHLVAYHTEGRHHEIAPISASYLASRVRASESESVTSATPLKPTGHPDPAITRNAFPLALSSLPPPVPQPYPTPNDLKVIDPFITASLIRNAATSGSTLQWGLGPTLPSPAISVYSFAGLFLGENDFDDAEVEETTKYEETKTDVSKKNELNEDEKESSEVEETEEWYNLIDEYMLKPKLDEEFD